MNNFNKIYIMPHFGLGDMINMIGGIRYYATKYKEVIVACPKEKLTNIKLFFRDNQMIKIEEPTYWEDNIMQKYNADKIYLCGFHKSSKSLNNGWILYDDVSDIPDCFYRDIEIEPKFRVDCFYFRPTDDSELLYNLVKDRKYIFIHNVSSTYTMDIAFLDNKKNEYILVNCAINMYNKTEYYYNLAERFVNRYIIDYSKIIENATELHLIDSSLFCFVNHLNLSKIQSKNLYVNSNTKIYQNYIQSDFNQFNYISKSPLFT